MSKPKKAMEKIVATELEKPTSFKLEEVKFKSERQFNLFKLLTDENAKLVFVEGPAGTAKSFLSIYAGLKLLKQEKVEELIYVRKAVECSEASLGYLPGEMEDKISMYMQPLEEKISIFLNVSAIKALKLKGKIKAIPVNFLRGVDWQNKCVIIDEAQNFSFHEFKTILTRIGENCKVFVIGDKMQSDIGNRSALPHILEIFSGADHEAQGIFKMHLTEEDIVRSGLCRHITKTFSKVDKLMRSREN